MKVITKDKGRIEYVPEDGVYFVGKGLPYRISTKGSELHGCKAELTIKVREKNATKRG